MVARFSEGFIHSFFSLRHILIQAINDNSEALNKNMDEMMDLTKYVGTVDGKMEDLLHAMDTLS